MNSYFFFGFHILNEFNATIMYHLCLKSIIMIKAIVLKLFFFK